MLEFEIAAMYYYVASIIKAHAYFEEVPQDMITPCVFYPTPNPEAYGHSVSAYETEFVMYIKFMDKSTMEAYAMGEKVFQAIMGGRRKIPLVDENGELTGEKFRVNMPKLKKIENGVYQMEISWTRYTKYNIKVVPKAQNIFMNGSPIGKEE